MSYEAYMDEEGNLNSAGLALAAGGLSVIQEACHRRAKSKGWWESGSRNMGEMIALMHSELSEALEAYRDSKPVLWYLYGDKETPFDPERFSGDGQVTELGKPEGLASEFADVLIRIFDTCAAEDIPLVEALMQKHAFNGTRPYRHGNKLA
jgi:NTP pyrophosphatase (non-canonical NTP hydrolase)